ncbi:MAG TPA: DUF177 domain-containing protein, partial [Saprospiraceae bacterium]|nr:DUF177 domain-containing protein [Saprospiraceae bacterium]
MDPLIQYSIPVKGLRNGIHQFDFQIDRSFFDNFENSPISDGDIRLHLEFDKRPDMFVLQFDFEGTVRAECDRCLAEINLPISDSQMLLVKFSLEEEVDEAEMVYISPETIKLNVAQYIYEFICLSMPMIKVYDCESEAVRPCDDDMLRYLSNSQEQEQEAPAEAEEEEQESKEEKPNPIWDELKKLSND